MEERIMNEWRILDKNAKGSFSTIYKVSDDNNNVYAIKKLELPLSDDLLLDFMRSGYLSRQEMNDYALSQIQKEISILEKFKDNENILKLYDVKEESTMSGKKYYLRMEYAEDIKKHFSKNNFTDEEIIKMSIDLCSALEALEKNNIVHTDIKPGNIFIVNNKYKLGDFGSSVELNKEAPVTIFGTMNYMAPEVYKKQKVDFSTDVYSLGIVMYTLLNGKLPFVSSTTPQNVAFEKRMNGEKLLEIFGVKEKLMNIILKACSYEKENRYKNASEMKEALININSKENDIKQPETTKGKLMGMFNPVNQKEQNEVITNNYTPIENEPTISIYDTEILKISKKNAIEIDSKKKKKIKIFKSYKIKKYAGLILLILLIPTGILANYAKNKTCDEGYINIAGRCLKGRYTCPEEYTLNKDNKCQKVKSTQEAKVTKKCIDQKNYLYDEETNLCKPTNYVEMQKIPTCVVDGFQYNIKTGKCERTEISDAYPQYYCSGDYNLVGDTCVKEKIVGIDATSKITCTNNYKMENKKCVKTISETMDAIDYTECPDGHTLSSSNAQLCTDEYSPNIKSPTYSYTGIMPTPKCESNYQLISVGYQNKCVANCNSGYELVSTGYGQYECVSTKSAETKYTCPDDWTKSGTSCIKTTKNIVDPTTVYSCPSGYNLNIIDNKCYSQNLDDYADTKKAKVNYICVTGGRLNNKKCYTTITQDPVTMPSCPDGYETNGLICLPKGKEHPPVVKYSCSRAYTLNEGRCEIYTYKSATPVLD